MLRISKQVLVEVLLWLSFLPEAAQITGKKACERMKEVPEGGPAGGRGHVRTGSRKNAAPVSAAEGTQLTRFAFGPRGLLGEHRKEGQRWRKW